MQLNLAHRHAMVLGASRGLGAAIARGLLAEGAVVYAASRSPERVTEWGQDLPGEQRKRLHPVQMDLNQPKQMLETMDRILALGPIDILVNNSGGPPPGKALDASSEQWTTQFQAMAVSLFDLTQRVLPAMRLAGWGRIITIASSGVEQPIPNLALSNAIRSSIVGWSKTLAGEVAAEGVTVNLVIPGRIHTDRVDALDNAAATRQGKTVAEVAQASAASIPAGRYGRPEEFADVVCFLASDRASYVTGSMIRIDGGMIRSV